ncbi:serine protease [Bradyrhizobium sp. URHD0069]|uniref:S1 family peptidase n=1 Tax=Bradyrhizobium sp. URHD0069 TaxID=1380355 RepID=UPI000494F83A|nr:serine protease [Bradyrhizobium sp. URHD0069]
MNWFVTKIVAILALLVSATSAWTSAAYAQHIPEILYHKDRAAKLQDFFRDRLLQISYEVTEKSTGRSKIVRGTGFVISPEGWALTAAHVFEPAFSDAYEQKKEVIAQQANGGSVENVSVIQGSIIFSKTADVALFRVANPSGADLEKYFCVERSENRLVAGSKVTIAAWRYYKPERDRENWYLQYYPSKDVEQRNGPGNLFEYLGFSQEFHNSMSGGAVIQNGKVVAVISNALMDNGRPIADGNYAYPLRYAKDVQWDGRAFDCGRAISGEIDFVRKATYENFSTETCEGSLAWIPDGTTREFYSFPKNATYRLGRQLLSCDPLLCSCSGPKPDKTVRLVINHRSPNQNEPSCRAEAISSHFVGQRTYYGAQVIPIFLDHALAHVTPQTWFFRNASLLRRSMSGKFDRTTAGSSAHWEWSPIGPTGFNKITRESGRAAQQKCLNLSTDECKDIAALKYFDKETETDMQWHGYPRPSLNPKSTLFGLRARELWAIPDPLLAQNLHLKNWILRFGTTTNASSANLVDFAFCVNADWDRFVVRTFAPERSIEPTQVEVLFDD